MLSSLRRRLNCYVALNKRSPRLFSKSKLQQESDIRRSLYDKIAQFKPDARNPNQVSEMSASGSEFSKKSFYNSHLNNATNQSFSESVVPLHKGLMNSANGGGAFPSRGILESMKTSCDTVNELVNMTARINTTPSKLSSKLRDPSLSTSLHSNTDSVLSNPNRSSVIASSLSQSSSSSITSSITSSSSSLASSSASTLSQSNAFAENVIGKMRLSRSSTQFARNGVGYMSSRITVASLNETAKHTSNQSHTQSTSRDSPRNQEVKSASLQSLLNRTRQSASAANNTPSQPSGAFPPKKSNSPLRSDAHSNQGVVNRVEQQQQQQQPLNASTMEATATTTTSNDIRSQVSSSSSTQPPSEAAVPKEPLSVGVDMKSLRSRGSMKPPMMFSHEQLGKVNVMSDRPTATLMNELSKKPEPFFIGKKVLPSNEVANKAKSTTTPFIRIDEQMEISELASKMKISVEECIGLCQQYVDHPIEPQSIINSEVAELVCLEKDLPVEVFNRFNRKPTMMNQSSLDLPPRAPVIVVMGHVDHGKTTLLDHLRHAHVAQGEAGGITQAISSFTVALSNEAKIVFIDTPGHASFTAMRARGTAATDIILMIVAADDGVKEQTIEVIDLVKSSQLPCVIAVTKCDLPHVNKSEAMMKVSTQLLDYDLMTTMFGGDIPIVGIDSVSGMGINELENMLYEESVARDIRADMQAQGEAIILESRVDTGIGTTVNAVVRWGHLKVGSTVVIGTQIGRVKKLRQQGVFVDKCFAGETVEIAGIEQGVQVGEWMLEVDNEEMATEVVKYRERCQSLIDLLEVQSEMGDASSSSSASATTHRERYDRAIARLQGKNDGGKAKIVQTLAMEKSRKQRRYKDLKRLRSAAADELRENEKQSKNITLFPVIVCSDVDGSVEAMRQELDQLNKKHMNSEFRIVHTSLSPVSASDVSLASENNCFLLSFHNKVPQKIVKMCENRDIVLLHNEVLYQLIDDMLKQAQSLMPPIEMEHICGKAEVLQVFNADNNKKIAGCRMVEGILDTSTQYKVLRNGQVIHKGNSLNSLRKVKSKVKSVKEGEEFGAMAKDYQEFVPGDIIMTYEMRNEKEPL